MVLSSALAHPAIRKKSLKVAIALCVGVIFGLWLLLLVASDSCLDKGGRVLDYGFYCEFEANQIVHWTAIVSVVSFLFVFLGALFVGALAHRALLKWR